ncbi:MAG TPA: ABC transporter substrate-binding protein [Methylomirabilota bacterium]|nr:ABC transporter substrate-binding protein [Methylomirabilota bacterium]
MKRKSLICLAFVGITVSPVWAETPTNTVKHLLDAVRSYKTTDRTASANAQKVVEGTLPIPELSKQVLGPQWEKLNAAEQKNFVQLLQELLKKVAYPKSAEFFGDLQIDFVSERVTGADAVVETMVSHPKEGQVTIEYKLHQAGGRWTLNDVLLDGVSLVTNVRTQMQQVIAKESYQGLLKRMRDKLTES